MFTGLISDLGRVRSIAKGGDTRISIATAYAMDSVYMGASIACSGVCLTVTEKGPDWFAVDASEETLSCTTIGGWREGTAINLERPLTLADELGGHLVFGHVDGVAEIADRREESDSIRFTVKPPAELARFIAPKGCVALDGISLTVNEVEDPAFGVNIIPHTAENTSFGGLAPGDRVNIEVDMLARYVARLLPQSRPEK
ncbi:MAG: riboflavin synthase [Alphaproteobacteria bacterium]|jgi:riboflavin synthase|nr:riboflavin synthase [Alphaproteobacteria bacterium]